MSEVEPIEPPQRDLIRRRVAHYIRLGERYFERPFAAISVRFDLSGRAAGMYRVRGRERAIRFNPWLFAKYFEDNLATTVPHEVAHYLTDCVHGLRRIKPHGPEWRQLMAVFGADASVTGDYSLEGIPHRRQRRYAYHCGCRAHELSSIRHNRVQRRQSVYQCRYCGGTLRPAP